jgi:biopolymer transport protein ExbD
MLTTKFKPQQDIEVLTPSSVSETKIPEKNLMLISVDQSGKVFLKIADEVKNGLISKVSEEYHINLSNQEKQKLADMSAFGAPLAALKSVVKTSSKDGMKIGDQLGIPCDSSNNELSIWIKNARLASPKLRFAIKGDKQVNYEVVDKVIATLQDENINKFNLITTMKMKQN